MASRAPTGPRHLAAIMFTDIVGFTALTQASESDALQLLERHNQFLRPFFTRFHGREVKTMGDSFLVEFDSALDAATCAVEIQRSLRADRPSAPERERIRVRIGIHLGDVVVSEGDVLGDAVNIASRIEPLAEPGGVCISGPVYDQVQNKVDWQFERVEAPELKNVQKPIPVYRIVLASEASVVESTVRPSESSHRLAVLPLTNMSPDPQDEFFADGLTEEIITELSRIPSLRVIARTSVMRYKAVSKPVREIGTELRVGYVLEGSVRKAGNRIRITTQLIEASTEEHLWADRFDRDLADIFAVQSDIASSVAGALDLRFRPSPTADRVAPLNVPAYTLYLQGRFLWNQRTKESIQEAVLRFQEAIALDPDFPLAHSGLADCYCILIDRGFLRAEEALPKARAEAERALALAPNLAEVHASMGLVWANVPDYPAADREFLIAIRLNPGYLAAHHWRHLGLLAMGRMEESLQEMRTAEELDPLSPIVLNSAAMVAYFMGQGPEAAALWERAQGLAPTSDAVTGNLVTFLALEGRPEEARAQLRVYEKGPADPASKLWVGALGHAVLGDREETLHLIERMRGTSDDGGYPPQWFGFLFAVFGDLDAAYEILLGSADSIRGSFRASFRVSPGLAKFRADPRFRELLRRWDASPAFGAARDGSSTNPER